MTLDELLLPGLEVMPTDAHHMGAAPGEEGDDDLAWLTGVMAAAAAAATATAVTDDRCKKKTITGKKGNVIAASTYTHKKKRKMRNSRNPRPISGRGEKCCSQQQHVPPATWCQVVQTSLSSSPKIPPLPRLIHSASRKTRSSSSPPANACTT